MALSSVFDKQQFAEYRGIQYRINDKVLLNIIKPRSHRRSIRRQPQFIFLLLLTIQINRPSGLLRTSWSQIHPRQTYSFDSNKGEDICIHISQNNECYGIFLERIFITMANIRNKET